jgi:hypothetical protein
VFAEARRTNSSMFRSLRDSDVRRYGSCPETLRPSPKPKPSLTGVPAGEDAAGGKGKAIARGTCSSAPAAGVEMANSNVDDNRKTIAEPAEDMDEEIEW